MLQVGWWQSDAPPDKHVVPKSIAHLLCRANGAQSPQPTLLAMILHYGVSLNPSSAPSASSPPVRGTAEGTWHPDMPLKSKNWSMWPSITSAAPSSCGFHPPPFAGAMPSPR